LRFGIRSSLLLTAAIGCLAAVLGCTPNDSSIPLLDDSGSAGEGPPILRLAVQSTVHSRFLDEMIERYNAEHPGYEVEVISLPSDRYDETLNTLLTSGQSPDLFQASPGWLGTYIYKSWLMDLSGLAQPEILKEYPEWTVDYTRENNHFYALPSEFVTLRLIYNKDIFKRMGLIPEQPPRYLQDLQKSANLISEGGTGYGIYGFALPGGDIETYRLALETASTSSGLYHFDFAQGQYDFTIYQPWFETMLEMKREGGLFPGETTLMRETALAQFKQGNVGMIYMTNREFAELTSTSEPGLAAGIALPPQNNPGPRTGALMVSIQHPIVISASSPYKEETAELWNYLHSTEFLSSMYELGELIPIPESARTTDKKTPAWLKDFLPGNPESPYPREPKFIVPWTSGDTIRMNAYTNIMSGQQKPYDSLDQLTKQHTQYLSDIIYRNYINLSNYVEEDFDPLSPLKRYSTR
jgi:multiple sugar transport system substrate-binding protein